MEKLEECRNSKVEGECKGFRGETGYWISHIWGIGEVSMWAKWGSGQMPA